MPEPPLPVTAEAARNALLCLGRRRGQDGAGAAGGARGQNHLVVPAGLKVATLAELTGAVLRPLGRWPRTLGGLAAVGAYAAVGGGGPAAIRAAIMGGLLALAPALGRAYNVFAALALAALIMTVIEPSLLYDAGFQLTTLATLGLPLLAPPIQRRLAHWLRWMPASAVVAELHAVTLAAQVATLPVLALTFHQLSLVAPPPPLPGTPMPTPPPSSAPPSCASNRQARLS